MIQSTIEQSQERPSEEFYDQEDSDGVCFLCGEPRYEHLYDIAHFGFPFTFKKCRCGLIKQTPMPNEKFFEWFFNSDVFFSSKKTEKSHIWGYYDYFNDEPSRQKTSARRFRKLEHHFQGEKPHEMIKVGPATGTFLFEANRHGHHAIGCDVSGQFAEYARTNYGAQIDEGRFERMGYKAEQFDDLILFNVIENIPNLDEFMREVHRTLKPNGLFIFNVIPIENFIAKFQKKKYFLFRPPICYIFTWAVLLKFLKKYGFEIVEDRLDIRYMHLEKIATLLGWRWLHALGRFLRIGRIPFPIYAYPSKVVVARKIS